MQITGRRPGPDCMAPATMPDAPTSFRFPPRRMIRNMAPTLAKSSVIGTFLGILPGIGPTTASFVSYAEARRTSKDPSSFGKGNPEAAQALLRP